MNVLSLFDGISAGQYALNPLMYGGKLVPFSIVPAQKYVSASQICTIPYTYYASEIDENAIKVTQKNFPQTIQLGDVRTLTLPNVKFDLILAGSPCQGFSRAGLQQGLKDSRSNLLFEFLNILSTIKERQTEPVYFILENTRMNKELEQFISKSLGVQPLRINSASVSAQNRERLYWTNIPKIKPMPDWNIMLSDIIGEYDAIQVYPRGTNKGGLKWYKGKSPCITTSSWNTNFKIVYNNYSTVRQFTVEEAEQLQTLPVGYTDGVCLSNTSRFKLLGNAWTSKVISHILRGYQ